MGYIEEGYNFLLGIHNEPDLSSGITTANADALFMAGSVDYDATTMENLYPNQDMQSYDFITGVQGWKIYGDGMAEFYGLDLTGGTIRYQKASFVDDSISGYYIGPEGLYFGSIADITKLKFSIATGTVDLVGTISGRDTDLIATTINPSGEVTSIINNLVTELKISAGAVTESRIHNLAISAAKIQNLAVGELQIAAGAVTAAKTNVAAINALTGGLTPDSVGTVQILDDAILAPKIKAGEIIAGKLSVDAVVAENIEAGAVITEKIYAGAITSDKIGAGEIVALNIHTDAITTDKIHAGAVIAQKIDTDAVTADKILAGSITATKIDAYAINGMVITGSTIQTAFPRIGSGGTSGHESTSDAMVLNSSNLTGYTGGYRDANHKRMQLDYDSMEYYEVGGDRAITYSDKGIKMWFNSTTEVGGVFLDGGYLSLYGTMANYITIGTAHRNSDNVSSSIVFTSTEVGGTVETMGAIYRDLPTGINTLSLNGNAVMVSNYFRAGASGYFNFSATSGSGGYGLRMYGNALQYYDAGSSGWKAFNSASGGETNTGSSLGTYDIYKQKSGVQLQFRGLSAGTGISMSTLTSDIQVSVNLNGGTNINTSGNTINLDSTINLTKVQATTVEATYYRDKASTTKGFYYNSPNFVFNTGLYLTGNIEFSSSSASIKFGSYTYGPGQIKDGDGNMIYVLKQL